MSVSASLVAVPSGALHVPRYAGRSPDERLDRRWTLNIAVRVRVFVCVALVFLGVVSSRPAAAVPLAVQPGGSALAPPDGATSKAWIVVDADSGVVLDSSNAREPMRVASTAKVLTALVVRRRVAIDAEVPISARAESMPALKISVKAGQRWNANDLLHSMLLASANDAAVALAEQAGGGSLDGFEAQVTEEARRLGLADHPTIQDPAGLDDEFSVRGGNLISARDLAIAARALLQDPLLSAIVAMPSYSFTGGDGAGHRVVGHNDFMRTYPGAIGVKTGYTERSGSSLIAAARRGNHTYLAVVIDSTSTDAQAAALLDAAFAGKLSTGSDRDVLPSVPGHEILAASSGQTRAARPLAAGVVGGGSTPVVPVAFGCVVVLALLLVLRRRQVVAQRRARRGPGQRTARPSRSASGSRSGQSIAVRGSTSSGAGPKAARPSQRGGEGRVAARPVARSGSRPSTGPPSSTPRPR